MTAPTPSTQPSAADLQVIADLFQRYPFLFPGMDARARVTVADVIDSYLEHARDDMAERTLESRVRYLNSFRDALGPRTVVECGQLDLKQWLTDNVKRWPSGDTRAGACSAVQRAFNWAVGVRKIRENPFRGFRLNWAKCTGRDMKPEEFQAILRHSDTAFRKFIVALKLTGARPSELSALRWCHVDWRRCIATLPQHKTARKTGKPRVIVLVPQVLKLLALIRRDWHPRAAAELRRILEAAPDRTLRVKEVALRLRACGFSYRQMYGARKAIGAVRRRVGGWAEHGFIVYELPVGAKADMKAAPDNVFLNSNRKPWQRTSLVTKFARLREKIGLPAECSMYGTRHFFATWAVKRGVNLKAVATLLGHTTTTMVERVYTHIDGDYAFLQQAAQAATALVGTPRPLPLPAGVVVTVESPVEYPRAVPRVTKRKPAPEGPRPLKDAERIAWEGYQLALREMPDGANATDIAVYEWLLGRPEFAAQLPPSATTFRRYLMTARLQHDGMCKRKKRRQWFVRPAGDCEKSR
jgi:integrase